MAWAAKVPPLFSSPIIIHPSTRRILLAIIYAMGNLFTAILINIILVVLYRIIQLLTVSYLESYANNLMKHINLLMASSS